MALIVVDAGSTKADWRIVADSEIIPVQTSGINPYFTTRDEMVSLFKEKVKPLVLPAIIDNIYFYGAGCAADQNKMQVRSALKECFLTENIFVETDLLGAARALLGNRQGLVILLGTGSNSGFYDGEKIIQSVDSLGYILGDEGSGANIGRLVLRDWLRNTFSPELDMKFFNFCQLSRDEILDRLYRQPYPNRFLAHFARFALENKRDHHMYLLIIDALSDLISEVVLKYGRHEESTINFMGTIANACSDILMQEAEADGLRIGRILPSPIEDLVRYHVEHL